MKTNFSMVEWEKTKIDMAVQRKTWELNLVATLFMIGILLALLVK